MEGYLSMLVNGLSYAMLLFLFTAGFTLQFGVLGVLNLAHGSFYMLGVFFSLTIAMFLGHLAGSFWIGLLIAPLFVALIGAFMERTLLRRIYGRDVLVQYLFTYTWIYILDDLVRMIWGARYSIVVMPDYFASAISFMGVNLSPYRLFIVAFGLAMGFILWYFLQKTKMGMFVRAASDNRDMVSSLGVNTPALFTIVFAVGAWLAGIGGVLASPLQTAYAGMGIAIIVDCFIVVVIGGMGSIKGAFIAALLIGFLRSFGIAFFPELEMALKYILMAAVIILRPRGLFGKEEVH